MQRSRWWGHAERGLEPSITAVCIVGKWGTPMPLAVFPERVAPVFAWVGLVHLAPGVRADDLPGAQWPEQALRDAALDGRNRFCGRAVSLNGVLMRRCATDLRRHPVVLRCVLGAFLAAGSALPVSLMIGIEGAFGRRELTARQPV